MPLHDMQEDGQWSTTKSRYWRGEKNRRPQITECSFTVPHTGGEIHWKKRSSILSRKWSGKVAKGDKKTPSQVQIYFKGSSAGIFSIVLQRSCESSTSKELSKPVLIAEHPSTKLFLQIISCRGFKSSGNQHPPPSQWQQALSSSPWKISIQYKGLL